jgi:hypothetical protein
LLRLRVAYDQFAALRKQSELPLLKNISPKGIAEQDQLLRFLDCAAIRHLHKIAEGEDPGNGFDTVRGMFPEGSELYPGAGFKEKEPYPDSRSQF